MNPEEQAILDKYNDIYHPGWREREAKRTDPLLKASTNDVARQLDEARALLREAVALLESDQYGWRRHEAEAAWLAKARSVAK